MKKTLLFLTALLPALAMMAEQIPAGYYESISGTQDSVLKSTLSLIVRGGERYEYGINQYHSTSNPPEWEKGDFKAYGTWQALPFTDHKPGVPGGVWDMYSSSQRYYPNQLGESGCSLNIEHCFPKSWWGGDVNDAYKDLYHLNPSDQRANGQKSNYAPGHVLKADKFDNGSFKMAKASNSSTGFVCFEPEEQYRGDFARAYFYIATAYEHFTWKSGTSPFDAAKAMDNNSYLEFQPWLIDILLEWHRSDPVSPKEICRADRISSIQHNRNPFIDYPELVEYIWGDKKGQTLDLASLTCMFYEGACPDDEPEPELPPCEGDTLINLPAVTAALVNGLQGAFTGKANSGVQSNGSASVTMGKSSTDGELAFSGLLDEDGFLIFRASPYNSASYMQIDIYANDSLIRSITDTVQLETRNEVRYLTPVPAGTTSIKIVSVGGSTTQRACIQELYLLRCTPDYKDLDSPMSQQPTSSQKIIRDGHLLILRAGHLYNLQGQRLN